MPRGVNDSVAWLIARVAMEMQVALCYQVVIRK